MLLQFIDISIIDACYAIALMPRDFRSMLLIRYFSPHYHYHFRLIIDDAISPPMLPASFIRQAAPS